MQLPFCVLDQGWACIMENLMEYFGVITGVLYLYLEIKQHKAMWVVGFISSFAYVFVFLFAKFYAMMALNIYYVLISIYGFWLWSQQRKKANVEEGGANESKEILYRRISIPVALGCVSAAAVLLGIIYFVLNDYTDSPVALGDSFITALSIVATWMLAHRILEHWPCWIVINSVSAWLYFTRELYPTMFLYACFAILAVVGYMNWKKKGVEI